MVTLQEIKRLSSSWNRFHASDVFPLRLGNTLVSTVVNGVCSTTGQNNNKGSFMCQKWHPAVRHTGRA
jgi:hypothetical protein